MKSALYCLFALLILSLFFPACSPKVEKVVVATDATWPPWEYINDEAGIMEGFDIDLFNAIAGKENLQVEFTNVALNQLLAGITECQYDAAISSLSITEERKKDMLFSEPYLEAGQQVVVRIDENDITDKTGLKGKIVGVQSESGGSVEADRIEGATVKTYDDIGPAFLDLEEGLIDAVVTDRIISSWYLYKNPGKFKAAADDFVTEVGGIAVCKTKPGLLKKINSGLKTVREEGLLYDLIEKWFINPTNDW
jgi:polar amino acid transport system substrate-binding protein